MPCRRTVASGAVGSVLHSQWAMVAGTTFRCDSHIEHSNLLRSANQSSLLRTGDTTLRKRQPIAGNSEECRTREWSCAEQQCGSALYSQLAMVASTTFGCDSHIEHSNLLRSANQSSLLRTGDTTLRKRPPIAGNSEECRTREWSCAEQQCRFGDFVFIADQDRIGEAEAPNAIGDLLDLLLFECCRALPLYDCNALTAIISIFGVGMDIWYSRKISRKVSVIRFVYAQGNLKYLINFELPDLQLRSPKTQ
jgi:hypothetical protein